MKIKKDGDVFVVSVEEGELGLGAGRRPAPACTLGTINSRGTIHARSAPRGFKNAVDIFLKDALRELHSDGRIFDKKAHESKVRESKEGDFVVRYSNGSYSRHHEMSRAQKAAIDWLKNEAPARGGKAEFYRVLPAGTTHHYGPNEAPWHAPFHVLEKNAHGHIEMAKLTKMPGKLPWLK